MTEDQPARKRNAEDTRKAILASARRAFADVGYDGAGLRGIAEAAGVTAMIDSAGSEVLVSSKSE